MSTQGYSGTPLVKKLGIKEHYTCYFLNTPEHYFNLLGQLPKIETTSQLKPNSLDFAHVFCFTLKTLEENFSQVKRALKKNGALWISWPKKSSKLNSDLDGNIVRTYGLSQGLVDVKVAAIDENWSGLKFMYRLKDR